jgi:hypothetical protein
MAWLIAGAVIWAATAVLAALMYKFGLGRKTLHEDNMLYEEAQAVRRLLLHCLWYERHGRPIVRYESNFRQYAESIIANYNHPRYGSKEDSFPFPAELVGKILDRLPRGTSEDNSLDDLDRRLQDFIYELNISDPPKPPP